MRIHMRHPITLLLVVLSLLAAALPFAAPSAIAAEVSASGVTGGNLRAVVFQSATTGFAVAANGVIVKSTDGGVTWSQVRAADSYSFTGVDYWDANNLVAVDYSGKVARSTNGGASWTNVDFSPYADMDQADAYSHSDVACVRGDNDAVVAAGDLDPYDGFLAGALSMRSTTTLAFWKSPITQTKPHWGYNSGSETWEDMGVGEFLDVEYVPGTTTLWGSGRDFWSTFDGSNTERYPLFRSADGGVSWAKVPGFGTTDFRLEGVAFGSASNGITVGQVVSGNRVAYRTTNGGDSWVPATTLPGTQALTAVDMSSATNGWAVSSDGSIIRTTDGGATWTACTIAGGNAFALYDVNFLPGTTTGWAVGDAGTVLRTTDGVNWQASGSAPPVNQAPVANNDTYTVQKDTTLVVPASGVLVNDNDPDSAPSPLTALKLTNPASGTVAWNAANNGAFNYTPSAGFTGTVTFTYKVNDGAADSTPATVTITVTADPPPVTLTPVYRFFRPSTGTHFYTSSESEMITVRDTMAATYVYEGIGYYMNAANPVNTVPLYRFRNIRTGTHLYTASESEMISVRDNLSSIYQLDGPAYFVSMSSGLEVHRFYDPRKGVHFYSSNPDEIASVRANLAHIWQYEGPAYKVGQ